MKKCDGPLAWKTFSKAISSDAYRTLERWRQSGAIEENTNPVILMKLAFKEAGENIALNEEMEKIWSNLKHF